MLDGFLEEFLIRFGAYMAWTGIALLIGAVPYLLVSRRRPDLRPRARGIYVGVAVLSAFLVADAIDLVPRDETEPGPIFTDLGPVVEAGRIERVAEGFVVTFPDDWTVQEPTPEGVESVMPGSDPREREGTDVVLLAYSGDSAERGQLCTIMDVTRSQQANPDWASLEDAVAGDLKGYGLDPTTVDIDSGYIDLPSGQAAYTSRMAEDGLYSRVYYLVSPDSWWVFGCGSRERPDDRWLSIAETFEFPPTGSGPVVLGGRIELPDVGFAVEFPDGWLTADLTHPDLIQQLESMPTTGSWLGAALEGSLGALFDDRMAIGHEMVLWASLAEEGSRNRQHCEAWVQESTMTSIRELVELNSEYFEDDPTQTWARVDLPAGQAARNDVQWSPTSFGSDYIFLDGHRLVTLSCVQGIPAEGVDEAARRDAWLSIAETIEFLPAEE